MNRRRAAAIAVSVVAISFVPSAAVAAEVCDGAFRPTQVPEVPGFVLSAASASARSDAWMVGESTDFEVDPSVTTGIALRWDGTAWGQVPIHRARVFEPRDISSIGSTRAWVAGRATIPGTGGGDAGSSIQRWNGTAWRTQETPPVMQRTATTVWAIDAHAPGDVWAAGSTYSRTKGFQTVVLRWNGTAWNRLATPEPIESFELPITVTAIEAIARDDVWVIGIYYPLERETFAMHWNGSGWQLMSPTPPSPGPREPEYRAIGAAGGDDVWIGGIDDSGDASVMRWDGSAWSNMPLDPGFPSSEVFDIVVSAPDDVLVLGTGDDGVFPPDGDPWVQRWDGSGWADVTLGSGVTLPAATALAAADDRAFILAGTETYPPSGGTSPTVLSSCEI